MILSGSNKYLTTAPEFCNQTCKTWCNQVVLSTAICALWSHFCLLPFHVAHEKSAILILCQHPHYSYHSQWCGGCSQQQTNKSISQGTFLIHRAKVQPLLELISSLQQVTQTLQVLTAHQAKKGHLSLPTTYYSSKWEWFRRRHKKKKNTKKNTKTFF